MGCCSVGSQRGDPLASGTQKSGAMAGDVTVLRVDGRGGGWVMGLGAGGRAGM